MINPETDQHFLVSKNKAYGEYVSGDLTLLEAAMIARNEFAAGQDGVEQTEVLIPERLANSGSGFEPSLVVNFVESLPIPADTVPLEEVFEFRERRASELSDFWHKLYDVAGQVACMRAANPTQEISRILGKSIEDCQRAANQSWGSKVARSLSIRFTLNQAAIHELGAALLNLEPVNLISGLFGSIGLSVDLLPKAALPSELARPLSYALAVEKMR